MQISLRCARAILFLGISYQPQFVMSDGGAVAVGIYGDFGVRLNYHHYRYISNSCRRAEDFAGCHGRDWHDVGYQ